MAYWLLKTEPSTYSYDDLEKAGKAVWDGVSNPVALRNIKAAKPGDLVVVYHTGDEKAAVGIAEVTSAAYPDPKSKDGKLVVFDLAPRKRLAAPVTLATIKSTPVFADSPLVKQGRLSVVPLDDAQWKAILSLSKTRL
jgi:predicted RNA-binding protein with PUA-like domain